MLGTSRQQDRTVIGRPPNQWLYDPSSKIFDLTRPQPPLFPIPPSYSTFKLSTTTKSVICAPAKTALIIIDMQNFFLSPYLGRQADGAGNQAAKQLLETGIPAARKGGIQIVWLNWGLTDADLEQMPASMSRAFGFEARLDKNAWKRTISTSEVHGPHPMEVKEDNVDGDGTVEELAKNGKPKRLYHGLGSEIGSVEIEDGKTVDAGRLLMRDTWNASLPPALDVMFREGSELEKRPDVWVHKNRMSGLWGKRTPLEDFLERQGITTLLFAGVNTDQCVGGTLQDAFSKAWDCILLSDASGTTSPDFARDCIEFNCARTWGFVTDCLSFETGIQDMMNAR